MSLCELGLLDQIGDLANLREQLVPEIQVFNCILTDHSGNSSKRSYSDCFSSEEDLTPSPQESYSPISSKRHCSYSIHSPPVAFQQQQQHASDPAAAFVADVKQTYSFGAIEDESILSSGLGSPCQVSSSNTVQQVGPLDFNVNKQTVGESPQNFDLQSFGLDLLPAMQPQSQMMLGHQQIPNHGTDKFELVIKEEPEEYYRARYNSEGVRAPLKGRIENYPAVQILGPIRYGRIDVKLVHEDGTLHTSCSLDTSEGRKNAVFKKIGPFNHMIAEFEDLRIRRVKKEGRKKPAGAEKSTPKDGRSDKIASLLFTAILETEHGELVQSIKSHPISLTTAPEPAELDWLEPSRGHFAGQEHLVIKGSKMTSPKVTFRIQMPDGRRHELHGSVDKERSHQNVLLVKTPSLNQLSYQFGHQPVRAEVIVITGRNQMPSNPLQFDFIPNNICRECMQDIPRPTHMTTSYCGRNAYPPPPPPPATVITTGGHSPPPTPSLPPPPAPSPTTVLRGPIQTSNTIHPRTNYSQTPIPVVATSDSTIISSSEVSMSSPEAEVASTGNEILSNIMRDLMDQEPTATTTSLSMHKEIESQYLYSNAYGHLERHVSSSYSIPVTSPSANSDQPCYSPITPVQSPPSTTIATWNYIEQVLNTLLSTEQVSPHDYRILQEQCTKQNPYFLQLFNASQNNEDIFMQMLASFKPEQTFQTTH